MSGNTTVDRASMQQAVSQIDQAHSDINGIQSRLTNEVQSLAAGWVGRASTAFVNAHETFNQKFNEVKADLAHIKDTMQSSQNAYSQTEEDQTQATNQIIGLL